MALLGKKANRNKAMELTWKTLVHINKYFLETHWIFAVI